MGAVNGAELAQVGCVVILLLLRHGGPGGRYGASRLDFDRKTNSHSPYDLQLS